MNIKYKLLENGISQIMIYNESHTLLRPLTEELRKNPSVTYVSYIEVHPLKKEMKLLIKSSENDELNLVIKTIDKLLNDLKNYSIMFETSI